MRQRTSMAVAAAHAGLLVLGGIALFVVVRAALLREFDAGLEARGAALQSIARFDRGRVELDATGEILPNAAGGDEAKFFAAWVQEGGEWRLLTSSDPAGSHLPEFVAPKAPCVEDFQFARGLRGRACWVEFVPPRENEVTEERDAAKGAVSGEVVPTVRIVVAQARGRLDRLIGIVGALIGVVGVALVAVSAMAARWAVRHGTRPLGVFSSEVEHIEPETLDQRIQADGLAEELVPVARRLNELLARLQTAFERERRFSAAASHELRTPLAELRMLLEVGLYRERSSAEWEHTAREGVEVLERAQALVETLLQVARSGTQEQVGGGRIDLGAVLQREAESALNGRGIQAGSIQIDIRDATPVNVREDVATSIIRNLIDNAIQHGEQSEGTSILASARVEDGCAHIRVRNRASRLSEQDIDKMFEPFWQKDDSRQGGKGFGLGLTVSRTLAESAGGSLTCRLCEDHWIEFEFAMRSAS